VAHAAAETCLQSFEASLSDTIEALPGAGHDRRLETLARRLAGVSSATELEGCLRPLAQALNAEVRLVAPPHHGVLATQLLADDPSADPVTAAALRAQGFSSRLALPIADRGRTVAYLEAYCHQQRPWTLFDIGRARIITYQLGPLLSRGDVALTR
jgi:GAF domain-containing protein